MKKLPLSPKSRDHIKLSTGDTIVALATPPGRGGVAIIRVSGSGVKKVATKILQKIPPPRKANYQHFVDEHNQLLDTGIAIFFPKPHSFTGEDVLELHCHGGPAVVDLLINTVLNTQTRLARPGEFSERAFLNDKIDLVQAESIADLIAASSAQSARSAVRSLQGEFSKKIYRLVENITRLRIFIEASIDFVEEEIDFLADEKITADLQSIITEIAGIKNAAYQGSLLRDGITIVIAGEPNVGKSTLLNYFAGREVAIVSNIPGTTRDLLRQEILLDGIPLHFIDTAGLRESNDVIELEGIRRARAEISQADLLISMFADENFSITPQDLSNEQKIIFIKNKIDLNHEIPRVTFMEKNIPIIHLSLKENLGLDLLKEQIKAAIGFTENAAGTFSARRRHLDALQKSDDFLISAKDQLQQSRSYELVAEDLRQAQRALTEITGEFSSDDLLGKIFSSFCIGK